jgi:hypothetical protein
MADNKAFYAARSGQSITCITLPDPQPQRDSAQEFITPAQEIVQHLLAHPYDLIDVRRLLRHFHASGDEFQQATKEVEHRVSRR